MFFQQQLQMHQNIPAALKTREADDCRVGSRERETRDRKMDGPNAINNYTPKLLTLQLPPDASWTNHLPQSRPLR